MNDSKLRGFVGCDFIEKGLFLWTNLGFHLDGFWFMLRSFCLADRWFWQYQEIVSSDIEAIIAGKD